jgi:uncharacterized membrane protein
MLDDKKIADINLKQESNLKSSLDFTKTKADHFTLFILRVFGSIAFLVACSLFFMLWILWNLNLLTPLKPFDSFPFPLLEMVVSLFAIILSVSVLINQNRQGKIERLRQQIEFEVNVRAEEEITKILNMVHEIHQKLGLEDKQDKELEMMKARTDIRQIHEALNEKEAENDLSPGF